MPLDSGALDRRRFVALALLFALLAPVLLFAGAGEPCDDDCPPACGDCVLCAGVAVGPGSFPRLALPGVAASLASERDSASGAPSRLPEPVPLARA